MPADVQCDRNMQHVLTSLIKCVVVYSRTRVSFSMRYHNGMNATKYNLSTSGGASSSGGLSWGQWWLYGLQWEGYRQMTATTISVPLLAYQLYSAVAPRSPLCLNKRVSGISSHNCRWKCSRLAIRSSIVSSRLFRVCCTLLGFASDLETTATRSRWQKTDEKLAQAEEKWAWDAKERR